MTGAPPVVSDRGRRMADAVNTALLGQGQSICGRWMAIRLSDGGSDGRVYDTKSDAVRHQLHRTQCYYVTITPDGITPAVASRMLDMAEQWYDAGIDLADPQAHVIPVPR